MSKTNYLEDELLDHVLRNAAFSSPTAVYVGLLTADPTEAGLTTNEVTGNAYAREEVTFGAPSSGTCTNSGLVTFTTASGGNWGTVTHFGIFDLVSGGNMLYHNSLTADKTINDGDTATIAIAALSVSED